MIERFARARKGQDDGFTLIELLVVIVILGVVSAVVVFGVRGVGDKGQRAAEAFDARTLRTAQEAFCGQRGHYAATVDELVAGQFLRDRSTLSDVAVATGPCGNGTLGPSGYDIVGGNVPAEVRHTGGQTGYPSPFSYDRGPGYMQMHYLYDTLLWKDARGTPIPWLAASMPTVTNNGTTYTFDLRTGVRWHDFATTGETLDANDVKFTFDYYKSRAAAGQIPATVIAQPLAEITSVNVVDADTVEFNLSTPAATFLQFGAAGAVPIAPQHIWSSIANPQSVSGDPTKLIGTGPYKLEPRSNTSPNFEYKANADYFLGSPRVKTIKYIQQGDNSVGTNLTALQNGLVDVATASGRPSLIDPWKADASFRVLQSPPGSSATQLNFNHAQAPFNDLSFRRAVALAIDRQFLIDQLFGDAGGPGNGAPGNPGWIPPGHPFYEPAAQQYTAGTPASRVAAANAQLDNNGYATRDPDGVRRGPGGQRMEFELTVAAASGIDTLLVSALNQIGVKLNPAAVGTPTLNSRINNGTVGMYLVTSGGLNSELGVDYLRLVYRSGATLIQRALNYSNPSLDVKLDAQFGELNGSARKAIASDIQKQIADDVPLLPLVYPHSYTIMRRAAFDKLYYTPGGVAGVVPNASNKQVFVAGRQVGFPTTAGT